jgi:hypothetical protein
MTDMSKYKNVSLTKETYKILESLSKVLLPDAKLSISKTIEAIANEKAKKLNGIVTRKENSMRQLRIIILLMMVLVLTNCTRLDFDSFDPTTSTLRWIIKHDK